MPCNVGLWIKDQPDKFLVYIDAEYISELGARLIETALDLNIANWKRAPDRKQRIRNLLRVHTG